MKSKTLTRIAGIVLFAVMAMPAQIVAQDKDKKVDPPRYTVTDLGALGGSFSIAFGINNAGQIGGQANVTGDGSAHGFLWVRGHMTDLGTLGGISTLNSAASGPNDRDELALVAETLMLDPHNENFCGFHTEKQCVGAVWRKGVMTALPTLGGENAEALVMNNRGQVTGLAETSTVNSCASPGSYYEVEAVIWGPKDGAIQELHPLPGDTIGFALGMNDKGDVVGGTGICANLFPIPFAYGPHTVLWENGSPNNPIDLGNLGGKILNGAVAINNRGEVVGAGDLPSEIAGYPRVQIHSFLWTKETGMVDTGTVDGDFSGIPEAINNNGQVVGASCDDLGNCRAYLRQDKVNYDLNALIPAGSPLYLLWSYGINDAGQIVGFAVVTTGPDAGQVHAFLATPCDRDHN